VKPGIVALWIFTIVLAVGATRLAGRNSDDSDGPGVSGGSSADSDGSFVEAFGEFEPVQRAYLISRSLSNLGPDNLPELLDAMKVRRMGIVKEEVRLVMVAWARFDPRGAWEWANEGELNWRPTLTDQAIYAWAYHDGPAARRVVEEIEEPTRRVRLRASMIDGWLRSTDKDGVSDYIANFDDVRRRGRLIFLLVGEVMMERGRDGAMRWVEAVPEDAPNGFKAAVFQNLVKLIAADDPRFAADWFLEHATRPYSQGGLEGIARRCAQHQKSPGWIFEWLLALDVDGVEPEEIDAAIEGGFRAWMQTNSEAAQAWLNSALPNPALDVATREAARYLLAQSPDVAMQWVQRIDDEHARLKQAVPVGRKWREKDPEALEAWLSESDLPEDVQQKILKVPVSPIRLNRAPKAAAAGNP